MSFSLFTINACQFNSCGLHFANLHDLLQHIEETHIPIVEAELKKKEECEKAIGSQQSDNPNEATKNTNSSSATPTLPLSAIYKLFPVLPAQKARPIKYEPTKISFCHYRKRPSPVSSVSATLYAPGSIADKAPTPCRSEHDEELSNDSFRNDDGDDGENGDTIEERRHKCPVEGCNKRYKNLQGARYHARQVHGITDETAGRVTPIEAMSNASGSQSPLTQPPTPSKYANMRPYKCGQCSKRYKTVVGLNNHVQQAHQRVNSAGNQSLTPNLVPVSPSAVSNSSGTHLHSSATSIDSSHNSKMVGKPLMSSGQMGVTVTSAHSTGVPPSGMRVSAQPIQTAPPPTAAGHQYHQQVPAPSVTPVNQSTATNMQVRSVGTLSGTSRTGSIVESRISHPGMTDSSQQAEQRGPHGVQSKVPQRVVSAGNLSIMGRNQYQHSQPMVHRVKMSTSTVGSTMGTQVVNVQAAQLSNSAISPPQTTQANRSQVFQQPQQHQQT